MAEDGIRDVERSRGLGDVYKRQVKYRALDNRSLKCPFPPFPKVEGTELALAFSSVETF